MKDAKLLKARATPLRKWPVVLCAAVKTLIMTPAATQSAVGPNHRRAHFAGTWRRYPRRPSAPSMV